MQFMGPLVFRRVPRLLRLRPPARARAVRGLPPAPAAEGRPLPQLLAAGRPPGRRDRQEGTRPRPRQLRRGQVAPAVVRRRRQDDPPPPAAPAGRGPRSRRAARSPLGAAGTAGPGPVPALPCPALDRGVGQQPRPGAGQGHRLPARRGPRLEPAHPSVSPRHVPDDIGAVPRGYPPASRARSWKYPSNGSSGAPRRRPPSTVPLSPTLTFWTGTPTTRPSTGGAWRSASSGD